MDAAQPLPVGWSPDGRTLVYAVPDLKTGFDLWALPLTGDRKPFPLVRSPFLDSHGQVSPDGKWLAYYSTETGRQEVYVQPFPAGAGKWQVSVDGGMFARWNPNGRELFFMSRATAGSLMAVGVKASGSTFVADIPKELFATGYVNHGHPGGPYHTFAVSQDGERFLIPRPQARVEDVSAMPIAVVLNWAEAVNK